MTEVSKEPAPLVGEVVKKGRRRTRRAGSRAARRRARKSSATLVAVTASSPAKCAVHAFLLKYQSAMRKIPAQLPPRVHAGPPTKRVKRVSWRKLRHFVMLQVKCNL